MGWCSQTAVRGGASLRSGSVPRRLPLWNEFSLRMRDEVYEVYDDVVGGALCAVPSYAFCEFCFCPVQRKHFIGAIRVLFSLSLSLLRLVMLERSFVTTVSFGIIAFLGRFV